MMNKYVVSWSGGKDSYVALQKAHEHYGLPTALLTMMIEDTSRSRSHGLKLDILQAQSQALGVPLMRFATSWADYEKVFLSALKEAQVLGVDFGVFGDIKIAHDKEWQAHRSFADEVCAQAGLKALEPLWDLSESELERDFLGAGIEAIIIAVKDDKLGPTYLGRSLDKEVFNECRRQGVHPLGERGEYHTLVINAPLFQQRLNIKTKERVYRDGYWFLDVEL